MTLVNFKIMAESQVKRRKLTDKALIKKHGAVLTADDVMRITGVASKATALKRMNCANEHAMLAKKGERAGYEYSQENKQRVRTDSLAMNPLKMSARLITPAVCNPVTSLMNGLVYWPNG